MTLSERITMLLNKAIKEEKKFTQVELANKMNVSPVSVNKWLRDGAPSIDKLPMLCEVLTITPNELFDYHIDDKNSKILALATRLEQLPEYQTILEVLLSQIIKDKHI